MFREASHRANLAQKQASTHAAASEEDRWTKASQVVQRLQDQVQDLKGKVARLDGENGLLRKAIVARLCSAPCAMNMILVALAPSFPGAATNSSRIHWMAGHPGKPHVSLNLSSVLSVEGFCFATVR